jgi:thiamine monophosphate synthase
MLMLVTRFHPELASIVRAAVDGGVNVVQVRGEVDADAVCAAAGGARVVISAGRRDAARPAGEDAGAPILGIHLPENAPFAESPFTGRSVHSVEAAIRAEQEGCDYILAGSVFPTTSHPNGPVAGVTLIEEIAQRITIPVIAIGGITATNARQCIDAGASGVAVISAIFDAEDPKQAAQDLWRAMA